MACAEVILMASDPISREETASLAAQVYAFVRACPRGRVTTYGWLAAAIGYPRGARMVGWMMNALPKGNDAPAHRVINSKGELTGSWAFGQRGRMRQLLEEEGIVFDDAGRASLSRFGWDPLRDLDEPAREAIRAAAATAPATVDDELLRLLRDDPASPFRIARDPASE